MQTIQACVNPRLLKKADRLFTGSLDGRIIEILQNARRAHATRVEITNSDGRVTVQDNGRGISDFSKLLDLGGSGWDESIESGEDPAGVGLFCLAPREVNIRSLGKFVNIGGAGWSGTPVAVQADAQPIAGTMLRFWDEPWTSAVVDRHAVFSGMEVLVDGVACPRESFVSPQAAHLPELGCRIEVREARQLSDWHNACRRDRWLTHQVLVNFHGQTVEWAFNPISERGLYYLVDLTGEPTGIRLMLPARTRLIENPALTQLKNALEREAFRHIQRRGSHTLPYREFQRARELGIALPEARPTFEVGLLRSGDAPEPVEVELPTNFPLSRCYRLAAEAESADEHAATNAHLLAALGTFESPFVPVEIRSEFDGYSWANLPTITEVKVEFGPERHADHLHCGQLACVEHIRITAHTSDGKTISSPVCMAKVAIQDGDHPTWLDEQVIVTESARNRLDPDCIWYHLGGWLEDGDSFETQQADFHGQLERFWADLIGPDENLRRDLMQTALQIKPDWQSVTITGDGTVTLQFTDGQTRAILPPPTPLPSL